jgi:hypothetical protein
MVSKKVYEKFFEGFIIRNWVGEWLYKMYVRGGTCMEYAYTRQR